MPNSEKRVLRGQETENRGRFWVVKDGEGTGGGT